MPFFHAGTLFCVCHIDNFVNSVFHLQLSLLCASQFCGPTFHCCTPLDVDHKTKSQRCADKCSPWCWANFEGVSSKVIDVLCSCYDNKPTLFFKQKLNVNLIWHDGCSQCLMFDWGEQDATTATIPMHWQWVTFTKTARILYWCDSCGSNKQGLQNHAMCRNGY